MTFCGRNQILYSTYTAVTAIFQFLPLELIRSIDSESHPVDSMFECVTSFTDVSMNKIGILPADLSQKVMMFFIGGTECTIAQTLGGIDNAFF